MPTLEWAAPTLWIALPDWTATLIVVVSGCVACGVLLAAALLPRRDRAAAEGQDGAAPPALGLDWMLVISALGIIGLALAVYLTRS